MSTTAYPQTRSKKVAFGTSGAATAGTHAARGAEEERERVRQVLHDGLGQLLTSISFLAGALGARLAVLQLPEAEQAEDILALTKRAINETQRLLAEPDAHPGS
jgi:signal transduction histidine kinase